MKTIIITGSTSGIGAALVSILETKNNVVALTRQDLNFDDINAVQNYNLPQCDMLINCAAHDLGGKVLFANHDLNSLIKILNTNLLSPIILSHKCLQSNANTKIVNITSTNINHYYGSDLIYTLTKKSLSDFTSYLKVDYPHVTTLEIVLGLTKTNFNLNRHKNNHKPIDDLYKNPHLLASNVANKIVNVLFDNSISKLEIKP